MAAGAARRHPGPFRPTPATTPVASPAARSIVRWRREPGECRFPSCAGPRRTTPRRRCRCRRADSVSTPIETTTPLAIRGARVWRSKSSLRRRTPGSTRASRVAASLSTGTQPRGIGPRAGDQDGLAVIGRCERPIELRHTHPPDLDRVRIAGDADDGVGRLGLGKGHPDNVRGAVHPIGKRPANHDRRGRIVARRERPPRDASESRTARSTRGRRGC